MYNRNRGKAEPQTFSEDQTRNTNYTMMQRKRKQQLEEQLENKEGLLKQYTNPRGIGMRGQTVNPRDVEILQEQIQQIKGQLEQITNPGGAQALSPAPGSSVGNQSVSGSQAGSTMSSQAPPQGRIRGGSQYSNGPQGQPMQQQPMQGQPMQQQPMQGQPMQGQFGNAPQQHQFKGPSSHVGSIGGASRASRISAASTGARSKRDEVYDRKYQNWLERTSTHGGSQASGPVLTSLKINNGPFAQSNPAELPAWSGMDSASGYQNGGSQTSTVQSQLTTSTGVGGRHRDQPANQWGGQQKPVPQLSQQPQRQQGSQQSNYSQQNSQSSYNQQQNFGYGQQQQQNAGSYGNQQRQVPPNQQQQQAQSQPQYGRRATPDATGQRPPIAPAQQQQQQQQQQQPYGGGNQPQQQSQQPLAGRRSASGSRPW